MLIALIALPFLAALISWFISSNTIRRVLLVAVPLIELGLVISTWFVQPEPIGELLFLDVMGKLVLTVTCILFCAATIYGIAYLHNEDDGTRRDLVHGLVFVNAPEATFTGCLFLFLSAAALVAVTQHFGLLWVGIETTTLVSAPLIYFHRHRRSLEATWKYLMICSVGIALALVGNLLLDISMQTGTGPQTVSMTIGNLQTLAPHAHTTWFKAAFVFLFIGYGTKMGLAPMHTWLPDAHSEAPSLVSALLSGALLNCAFLGIFRIHQVSIAAGEGNFSSTLLITFGLLSLLVASLFIVGQKDFKRMLAYSSVEHMGILLLGLGLVGGLLHESGFARQNLALGKAFALHLVCHSLIKAALFLLAGNILARYNTKTSGEITGLGKTLPYTGALWIAGIIAITGSPPFGIFITEISILQSMLAQKMWFFSAFYLLMLGIIFVGMITPVVHMYRGEALTTTGSATTGTPHLMEREKLFFIAPPAILLGLALCLGVYMPQWLEKTLVNITLLLYIPDAAPTILGGLLP